MGQTNYHGGRAQLLAQLHELPSLLAGQTPDPARATQSLLGALGLQALALIKESYVVKSRGGTDDAGIAWAPLSSRYVAYQRRHPALTRKRRLAARTGRARRPLLTATQDKMWRQIYARSVRRFLRQGASGAESAAAAIAWAVLKRAGGKTILGQYGNTPVEIGRDTGRLLNSLSPGQTAAAASSEQIFRVEPGAVTVGTNVKYARPFHRRRPLWPEDASSIPASWWQRLGNTLSDGLTLLLQRRLG